MLEALIAYHCAPALAGIKPANIVMCRKDQIPNVKKEIEILNCQLNGGDIYFEIICECEKRVLVMAYRKSLLEKHLCDRKNRAFLSKYGYPKDGDVSDYIFFLKSRMAKEGFPHEVGVFLGYPLCDIYGFINHKDEGCLLTGEWRVYRNAEEAEKMFCRFKKCRKALSKRVADGRTLAEIFCVA